MRKKINNWTLGFLGTLYTAPEYRTPFLHGLCVGEEDRGNIRTSRVLRVVDGVVYTRSGSEYALGTPSKCWNQHLEGRGHDIDHTSMDAKALVMDTVPGDVFGDYCREADLPTLGSMILPTPV